MFVKMFKLKKKTKKSPITKGRKKCWTMLQENLTKLTQQTDLQLAVVLTFRKHTKTLTLLFCLTKQSTSGWENFASHSGLKKTWRITRFAQNSLLLPVGYITFLQPVIWRSYRWWLQTIFYICLFVCIFSSDSLSKLSKFRVFIFWKKNCASCYVFRMFLLKN